MKDIEHKMTLEHLQALFEGKKLVLDYAGQPKVVIYPPNYVVFVPYDEWKIIERSLTEEEKAKLAFIKNTRI